MMAASIRLGRTTQPAWLRRMCRPRSALPPSPAWPGARSGAPWPPGCLSLVAADTVCGVSELEMALRRAGKGYVPGMSSTQQVWWSGTRPDIAGTAEDVAAALAPSDRQRLSAGAGTKGPRVYDWTYVELADLNAQAQSYPGSHGL